VTDTAHHVTVLHVRNTPSERRLIEQMKEEFDFEENEFHLFCWYLGYRMALCNFRRELPSDDPPEHKDIKEFVDRHKGIN
jgi:hypothetical protein